MITWFQIGLTAGESGDYLANWDAFQFFSTGDHKDFVDYIRGRLAAEGL